MRDLKKDALLYHSQSPHGKIAVVSTKPVANKDDLTLAYTPGVAEPCKEIANDVSKVYEYTAKGNMVAIVTDGTRVLGLGNIGPEAALPVMEGKAILFKTFANVDAFPICVRREKPEEVIETVKRIAPSFGAVNLEDIESPDCFMIEDALQDIGIPVFHDDQHGTAIVIVAGLENALTVVGKEKDSARIVVAGAGAAGIACTRLLHAAGFRNVVITDSKGIIHEKRKDITDHKLQAARITRGFEGSLGDAVKNADAIIALSGKPGLVTKEMIASMSAKPIVFALTNPMPEISPEDAKKFGAAVIATGRSDYPNQVNNALAFPGVFRGALDIRAKQITEKMKLAAMHAIASSVKNPTEEKILPSIFENGLAYRVAEAVKEAHDARPHAVQAKE